MTLLSILSNRAVAVPLAPEFPAAELRHILNDCSASVLLASTGLLKSASRVLQEGVVQEPVLCPVDEKQSEDMAASKSCHSVDDGVMEDAAALMLYTSGTTGRPKGVLLPQAALAAQCQSLIQAWDYRESDHVLHVLPLHHIHGVVNALLAPLHAGASVEFLHPFNATAVWQRLAAPFLGDKATKLERPRPITVFTAVPTMYSRLLSSFSDLPQPLQEAARVAISPRYLRLNMSGSAALPTPIKAAWTELSNGNVLLERYGMTEIGMALSCGLDLHERVDGSVGRPLPSVDVRLVDIENGKVIAPGAELDENGEERQGEIQVRGPAVFKEYWVNPEATQQAFDQVDLDARSPKTAKSRGQKWFKTGDVAVRRKVPVPSPDGHATPEKGPMYFIMGRANVDIIKSGGEKISALEVERELLSLPGIIEAAVVGLPSESWGQKVATIVVLAHDKARSEQQPMSWSPMDLRRALRDRLASHKIPQVFKIIKQSDGVLPRNVMGKAC